MDPSLDDLDALSNLDGLSDYSTDDEAPGGDYRKSKLPNLEEHKSDIAKAALGVTAAVATGGLLYLAHRNREGLVAKWNAFRAPAIKQDEDAPINDATTQKTEFEDLALTAGYKAVDKLTFEDLTARLKEQRHRDRAAEAIKIIFNVKLYNIARALAADRQKIFDLAEAAGIEPDLARKSTKLEHLLAKYTRDHAEHKGQPPSAKDVHGLYVSVREEDENMKKLIGYSDVAAGAKKKEESEPNLPSSKLGSDEASRSTEVVDYHDQLLYYRKRVRIVKTLIEKIEDEKFFHDRVLRLAAFCKRLLPTARAQPALWNLMASTISTIWSNPGYTPAEKAAQEQIAEEEGRPARPAKPGMANIALFGRSGVGKSTAAKDIAEMFKLAGVVVGFDKELRPTRTSELLNSKLGMSERQLRRAVYQAYEDVIFIDEAQGLAGGGGNEDVAKGVVNWLTEWLGDHPREIVMIIAGYGEDIRRDVFKLNYGLARRFRLRITIQPHLPGALMKMYAEALAENNWKIRRPVQEAIEQTMDLGFLFPKSAASLGNLVTATRKALRNADVTSNTFEKRVTLAIFWDALHNYGYEDNVPGWQLLSQRSGTIILPAQVDAVFSERQEYESEKARESRLKKQGQHWASAIRKLQSGARQQLDYFDDLIVFSETTVPEKVLNRTISALTAKESGPLQWMKLIQQGKDIKTVTAEEEKFQAVGKAYFYPRGNNYVFMQDFKIEEAPAHEKEVKVVDGPEGKFPVDLDLEEEDPRLQQDSKAREAAREQLRRLVDHDQTCRKYLRMEIFVRPSRATPRYIMAVHLISETKERIIMTQLDNFKLTPQS